MTLAGSLSARRAWIEIHNGGILRLLAWSLSARRAWIEISYAYRSQCSDRLSLSARRAWIEIHNGGILEIRKSAVQEKYRCVALRKESVDRNRWGDYSTGAATVALRKESVDRNVGA